MYYNPRNRLESTTDFKYLDKFGEIRTDIEIIEVLLLLYLLSTIFHSI